MPRLKGLPFRLPPSASPLIPRAVQVTPEPRPGAYLGASLPPGFNAGRVVVSFSDLTPVSLRLWEFLMVSYVLKASLCPHGY